MRRILVIATTIGGLLALTPWPGPAQPPSERERAELAHALEGAWLPLESGLALSTEKGAPISAKYEIEDGALQLSVYTSGAAGAPNPSFAEVIVDYSAGMVTRVEPLTDDTDLAAARSEQAAMASARRPLSRVTAEVVNANPGYRAVSVSPIRSGDHAVAEVTLVRGQDWKVVTAPLD